MGDNLPLLPRTLYIFKLQKASGWPFSNYKFEINSQPTSEFLWEKSYEAYLEQQIVLYATQYTYTFL